MPNLTQALELLSAPDEVKTEVMSKLENGEDVSIKEIRRLKQELADRDDDLKCAVQDIEKQQKVIAYYIENQRQPLTKIVEKIPDDYESSKKAVIDVQNKLQQR